MSTPQQPLPGTSLTCDACGVSRAWGAWDSNSKAVICATCLSKGRFSVARGTTVTRGQRHESGYDSPSDAVAAPTISAAKVIREA